MRIELELPEPTCRSGYTASDLEAILGDRIDDFWDFMVGQTMMLCDGTMYDHERQGYFTTECSNMLPGMPILREEIGYVNSGHGGVVYRTDLQRYLWGLPVID